MKQQINPRLRIDKKQPTIISMRQDVRLLIVTTLFIVFSLAFLAPFFAEARMPVKLPSKKAQSHRAPAAAARTPQSQSPAMKSAGAFNYEKMLKDSDRNNSGMKITLKNRSRSN